MSSGARIAMSALIGTVLGVWVALAAAGSAQAHGSRHPTFRLVIGHRGAPGYRPEHSWPGYELAVRMGADYIEPDLVSTKDGVLVDFHDATLGATTDVASRPEFAAREVTRTINGSRQTGWFVDDFTWAELRTLRVVERIPSLRPDNVRWNGRYRIMSFREDLLWARQLEHRYARTVGVIPEIKFSTYLSGLGLSPEQKVLDTIARYATVGGQRVLPIVIQSAEVTNLAWLHQHTDIPLMQLTGPHGGPADLAARGDLTTWADLTTPSGLATIARYASYVGAVVEQVLPTTPDGTLGAPTSLIRDAHAAGLRVAVYSVRAENTFLLPPFRIGSDPAAHGDAAGETRALLDAGADAVFTDYPDIVVAARRAWAGTV